MKKPQLIVTLLLCAFILNGCSAKKEAPKQQAELTDRIPMVMIDHTLYLDTGLKSLAEVRCGMSDGEIDSTVDSSETPTENGQSNFGAGYSWQYGREGTVELQLDNGWYIFATEALKPRLEKAAHDPLGIALTAENASSSGLTLICTQWGGSPSGELMTGAPYRLEKEYNGQWKPVPTTVEDVVWTSEGWIIPMNQTAEWDVDWSFLYGTLDSGNYRIYKEVIDLRQPGDFDQHAYFAEFTIK